MQAILGVEKVERRVDDNVHFFPPLELLVPRLGHKPPIFLGLAHDGLHEPTVDPMLGGGLLMRKLIIVDGFEDGRHILTVEVALSGSLEPQLVFVDALILLLKKLIHDCILSLVASIQV